MPKFPIAVLAYPIFETLFSIYRKKFKRGMSAFKPDKVHFHMLIHRRIAKNNPKTSLYIWPLVAVLNILALYFHSNTPILILIFILFSFSYIYIYKRFVRFKGGFYKNRLKEKVKMDIPVKTLDSIKIHAKTVSKKYETGSLSKTYDTAQCVMLNLFQHLFRAGLFQNLIKSICY